MEALGWRDYSAVEMAAHVRQSFRVVYWRYFYPTCIALRIPLTSSWLGFTHRRPTPSAADLRTGASRPDVAPPHGGMLYFTIKTTEVTSVVAATESNLHVNRVLVLLERESKLRAGPSTPNRAPSDVEERAKLVVEWKPVLNALSQQLQPDDLKLELNIVSEGLYFPWFYVTKPVVVRTRTILTCLRC